MAVSHRKMGPKSLIRTQILGWIKQAATVAWEFPLVMDKKNDPWIGGGKSWGIWFWRLDLFSREIKCFT